MNRSAEFDRGVLGLIREYSPTLQTIDDGARPVCCGPSVRVSFGGHSSIQREHLSVQSPLFGDGDAIAVEVHRFRHLYNTIRPHQALADRTPAQVYTAPGGGPGLVSA